MCLEPTGRLLEPLELALIRERKPPFSPEQVVEEFAKIVRSYRCTKVYGDRYGGEWPREQFRKHGVNYECSDKPKSELYRDLLPLINSGAVDLIEHDRLVTELSWRRPPGGQISFFCSVPNWSPPPIGRNTNHH